MPININIKTKFIYNGKEYANPDEMPPEIRTAYEQALAKGHISTRPQTTKITINGKTYESADDIPENLRPMYDQAMRSVDKNQDGIPDAFQQNAPGAQDALGPSAPFLPQQPSAGRSSKMDARVLALAGMAILVLLILGFLILVLLARG
jgi:hypothetical protein